MDTNTETFDYEQNLLRQYDNWGVYLHPSQVYLGRAYIALARGDEIDPFTETTEQERSELVTIIGGLRRCLNILYQPNLINYANLRNEWHHCHWHVIPRYQTPRIAYGHRFTDPNWGSNYVPYDMTNQVPAQVFGGIRTDLRAELISL